MMPIKMFVSKSKLLSLSATMWLVVIAAGCPAGKEQTPSAAARKSQQAVEMPTQAIKLPEGEFRRPPALPPSAPPPKLADVSDGSPVAESAGTATNPPVAEDKSDVVSSKPKKPARPLTKKNSGVPFDPIKENGPIFVGWPKPDAALVITGMEHGYIEPCGCAGLDRMKGGMSRRHTFIEGLRKEGWPLAVLDAGGLARGFGRQAEMRFHTMVESKRKMGYDAIAFGADDLRLPAGELVAAAAEVQGKPGAFVSANVGLFGFDAGFTPDRRIIKAGKFKIGVTAVLGKKHQAELHNDEIEFRDPEEALAKVVPELKKQADYLVLLAHASRDEAEALARRFPQFNAVVVSDGPATPPAQPETIKGTETLLIDVGQKGMDAIVLGLYGDKDKPTWRYQRVPLDSRFAASDEMRMLLTAYQEQIKIAGFAGLGLRAVPHPQAEGGGKFVGSKKCQSCHEISYDIWKKSGHAKAYQTLVDLAPPRNFDPECVSCHVVGWHPTKYFPYQSGFESLEKTPELIDVGCESCHGPGEKHCAAELGNNEKLQEKYRKASVITKEESRKSQCVSCHDLDNSPDFDFDAYWPLVEHYERD
jgi:hypothetical protein